MLNRADNPTLEDLRAAPEPAWLWDGARGRIVWANAAGVSFFGCESLFDLIDRPFDQEEPGVAAIMSLGVTPEADRPQMLQLSFPSAGKSMPMSCQCSMFRLADGRDGVMVVGERQASTEIDPAKLDLAFELLPMAASFMGQDGSLHRLNAAARLLLTPEQGASLKSLIGTSSVADDLLKRLLTSGTISEIKSLQTKIGLREMRITLRKLGQSPDSLAHAMLLLDDLTERRALERSLSAVATEGKPPLDPRTAAAKPLAPRDEENFRQLGQALQASALAPLPPPLQASALASLSSLKADPEKQLRTPPEIPAMVTDVINRLPEAVLIATPGQIFHANAKALEILGFATVADMINDNAVWELFTKLDRPLPRTSLKLQNGREIDVAVDLSMVAWKNGPARQLTLREIPKQAEAAAQIPAPVQVAAKPAEEPKIVAPAEEIIRLPQLVLNRTVSVADDELRAILDTATDGIITLDAQGRIHTFSAGAEAIFGYRIAEVIDQPFSDFLALESRKVLGDYLAALQGPGVARIFNDGREVLAIVKQGGTVPLFLTIGALHSASSKAAFCAVVRDITQWKRTEAELRQAKEVAEATSRQKSEFLARISHELRTPLNAIMGFSEVMRLERFGEIKNDKYRGYVNDIHASGGLLLSLINDLLDLSKVESGQLDLNFTAVNLNDTTDYAVKLLQEAATAARVVIRKTVSPNLPDVVADQRSMRQIMLNILSNAIKFTDPGGQIIVSALVDKSGELRLKVKDTGIGMNSEQLHDALQPFKRVTTEGRSVEGTGLGLPLIKALTEANRAAFSISSEPRKGTLIEIIFPTTRVLAE